MSTLLNDLVRSVCPRGWSGVCIESNFWRDAPTVDESLERTDVDKETGFDASADRTINLCKC